MVVLTSQCEEVGRRRGEGEREVGKLGERVAELEKEVREGEVTEERLQAELKAMTEVRRAIN